jgi:2-keto-4-pentenoate hydratase
MGGAARVDSHGAAAAGVSPPVDAVNGAATSATKATMTRWRRRTAVNFPVRFTAIHSNGLRLTMVVAGRLAAMPQLTDAQVAKAANDLFQAELNWAPIEAISLQYPTADIEDAYRISLAVTDLKLAAGRQVKGHKIGLTSKAMRSLSGATEPDYGTLFDNWFILEGETVPRSKMNRPLVEVELSFIMKKALRGPSINIADVMSAVDYVVPSIEVVDTRQTGGGTMLINSVSDAAACGYVILGGNPFKLNDIDVRNVGATLSINGEIEESGMARAVMGNPLNAVTWLINKLAEYGVGVEAGHTVLSGSFIKAIPFQTGDSVIALFNLGLGEVSFRAV